MVRYLSPRVATTWVRRRRSASVSVTSEVSRLSGEYHGCSSGGHGAGVHEHQADHRDFPALKGLGKDVPCVTSDAHLRDGSADVH